MNENSGENIVGASILPFSVDPRWGKVYFLLGKERKHKTWICGSEQWSDFGGRIEHFNERGSGSSCSANNGSDGNTTNTPTPECVAAREFVEETMGMVAYFQHDQGCRTTFQDIADSLARKEYLFRVVSEYTFDRDDYKTASRKYITFVKQIPWQPSCVQRFADTLSVVYKLRKVAHADVPAPLQGHPMFEGKCQDGFHMIRNEYVEKKKLGWWSIPQLKEATNTNGALQMCNGRIERCKKTFLNFIKNLLADFLFHLPEMLDNDLSIGAVVNEVHKG